MSDGAAVEVLAWVIEAETEVADGLTVVGPPVAVDSAPSNVAAVSVMLLYYLETMHIPPMLDADAKSQVSLVCEGTMRPNTGSS